MCRPVLWPTFYNRIKYHTEERKIDGFTCNWFHNKTIR